MDDEAIDLEFKKLPPKYVMYDCELVIPHLQFSITNEFDQQLIMMNLI
jgi:hypothetical protein